MSDRHNVALLVVGVGIFNGIFSPYLKLAIPIAAALLPELFPRTVEWVLFWGSIFLASATLLFSGIPAALYERLIARDGESTVSMWIWLAGAALLSIPAVHRVL